MRLICPTCGATASIEAWQNDILIRQFEAKFMGLPAIVQPRVTAYLGLFRKGDQGLAWRVALKHLTTLVDLIAIGRVSWERSELRPAPPELWAEALDAVLSRAPRGLTNHNYLRHTAFDMASGLASREERTTEDGKRRRDYTGPELQDEPPVSDEERASVMRQLREFAERFGK